MSPKAIRLVDELQKASADRDKKNSVSRSGTLSRYGAPDAVETKAEKDTGDLHISHIMPLEDGARISLTLTDGAEKRQLRLMTEQYAALHPTEGQITTKFAEALSEAGKLCDAVCKGTELLGYGAMSRRRLIQKLMARGYEHDVAAAAVELLVSRGFLSEDQDAVRFAEQGVRKLWGPRRIKEDLYARGFPAEAVQEALESLVDVDFESNCAKVIDRKYGIVPMESGEKKKMMAALMRLGYTSEQIRAAIRSIK